jgi:GPH family glycoside/pentoside/hexuronide:cation symporter
MMSNSDYQPLKFYHFSAYGFASIGKVAVEMLLQLYLFDFYTRVLGLSPILAGSAFAIAIVWDAVSDIAVSAGLLYARKRKLLYTTVIFSGAIVLALSIYALFAVGPGESQVRLFSQLLLAYVFVNTGMTLIDLPQTSMSSELSPDSDERNKLLGFRLGMSIVGLAIGSALPGLLLKDDSDAAVAASRSDSGEIVALIVVVSSLLTIIGLREPDRKSTKVHSMAMPSFKEAIGVIKQKVFSQILYASLIAAIGRTINAALALMYYRLVLNLSEGTVTQIIFPVFTLSIVLSIPLWTLLSKRYGKARPAWISVGSLGFLGIGAYPILPEGTLWPVLLVSIIAGVFCGSVFLVDSMITDLIDKDEAESGKRKESLFFAIQKSVVKMSRAIAFIFIGGCLELFDLDVADAAAEPMEQWIIIGLFAFVVGLCFIGSSYFLRKTEMTFNP